MYVHTYINEKGEKTTSFVKDVLDMKVYGMIELEIQLSYLIQGRVFIQC